MQQVGVNAKSIKNKDPNTNIALMTNCNVPLSVASFLDVIVPIHNADVMNTTQKQWRTRMLYNAYLPFNYSFIIDSHVFPCDKTAAHDILSLFEKSGVDISFSNRVNQYSLVSGGGVLSRWSEGSFLFWKNCYKIMILKNKVDDQGPMRLTVQSDWRKHYKFKWLSSNWMFASHGITEKGIFSGPGRCYRSSVIVTGPVRWIHGSESECPIMNGKNNEIVNRPRCYFKKGKCNTTGIGIFPVFSEAQLKKTVYPATIPKLRWEICSAFSKTSLFWEDKYYHPPYN